MNELIAGVVGFIIGVGLLCPIANSCGRRSALQEAVDQGAAKWEVKRDGCVKLRWGKCFTFTDEAEDAETTE